MARTKASRHSTQLTHLKTEPHAPQSGDEAWEKLRKAMHESRKRAVAGEAYRWKREDYYDDPRYRRAWSR